MKFSSIQPYLKFTRSQRAGLFVLLTLIVIFQIAYFAFDFRAKESPPTKKETWMALQVPLDSLKTAKAAESPKIYPFNPNFITDFKGYKLGMSVAEIDRLLAYRKTDRYVNSAEEFQQVTQVSDSLLHAIAPYFKFPDWVKNRNKLKPYQKKYFEKAIKIQIDINLATQEDLKKVYGIGDGLSERILKEKEKLGGFVSMEQMKEVWGLSPDVIEKLNESFKVAALPEIKKVNINTATVKELMQFPYFRYALAKAIVTYRSMNGEIKTSEDLIKISGFPVDKLQIIALYLDF
jgi:DNA uptake protein ComE-like DNA-binding protein